MLFPLLTLALAPTVAPESHNDNVFGTEAGTANFNYTYVELDLVFLEPDASALDSETGFQFVGSVNVWRDLFVRASFLSTSGDADFEVLKFGAGWAFPLQEGFDAYGAFSIVNAEAGPFDESGWALEGGVRYAVSPEIELNGLLELVDVEDTEFGFGIGGRYNFNPNLSVGLNFETISDFANMFYGGVRYAF